MTGKPCGTPAAYRRHLRNDEPVDELCAEAARVEKNERAKLRRESAGAAVADAYTRVDVSTGEVSERVDPLGEARDNLRIVRAALRANPPHNTIAALTKRRDELVDRLVELEKADTRSEFDAIIAQFTEPS